MKWQEMRSAAVAKTSRRKRVNLKEGDVFEMPLPDGRFGYGVVVKQGGLPGGGTPYIAVFGSAYDRRPDVAEITSDKVALQGWTTDALIYHDRWKVIGHDALTHAGIATIRKTSFSHPGKPCHHLLRLSFSVIPRDDT